MAAPIPNGNPNGNQIRRQYPLAPPTEDQGAIERPIRGPIQPSTTHNGFTRSRFDPHQLPPLPPRRGDPPMPWRPRPPPYRVDQHQRIRQMNHILTVILERWEAAHSTLSEGRLGPGYASVDLLQADYHDMQTLSRLVEGRLKELGERLEEARGSNSFSNRQPTDPGMITMTPIPAQLLHQPGSDSHSPSTEPLSSSHGFGNGSSGPGLRPPWNGPVRPVNQLNAIILPTSPSGVGNTNTNHFGNGVNGVNGSTDRSLIGNPHSNDDLSLVDISSDGSDN